MSIEREIDRIKQVYSNGYKPHPMDVNYTWHPRNPVSLYYRQSQERTIIKLINNTKIPIEESKILDAGCGTGNLLRFFIALQAAPENLFGIDLIPKRIQIGKLLSPTKMHFMIGNICALPFPSESFDLVCAFTVFSSILNSGVRRAAASQLESALRPGGLLLWYDFHRGTSDTTRGLPLQEIDQLFDQMERVALYSMHPLRASAIARRSLFLCEILERIPLIPRTHWLALYKKG